MIKRSHSQLKALSERSLTGLLFDALIRAVVFVLTIQTIALISGRQTNQLPQMFLLIVIFAVFLFCFAVIEKYWALEKIKRSR